MITGIDHVVIAVRDLARAVGAFERLGFEIAPGGRHPGAGTENALVRFPESFLELVSVHDEREEREHGMGLGAVLAERAGPVGFALRSNDIHEDARRLREAGLPIAGPLQRSRDRADGRTVRWSGMVVGDDTRGLGALLWSSPLPFVIQWTGPAAGFEPPGAHRNGAIETASVTVGATDSDEVVRTLTRGFGLGAAEGAVRCGPMLIRVVRRKTAGVESVAVAVRSLAATRDVLRARGVSFREGEDRLIVASEEAAGARLAFVTRP